MNAIGTGSVAYQGWRVTLQSSAPARGRLWLDCGDEATPVEAGPVQPPLLQRERVTVNHPSVKSSQG